MNRTAFNKICASIVLGGVLLQSFFFVGAPKAEAITFASATQGIVSAGIGCAAGNLLRKGAGKLSSWISSEAQNKADESLEQKVAVSDSKNQDNTKAIANKETCLKKIARAASQIVLKEVTRQTVNWINNGFHGQSLFLKNPKSFFKSLADKEVQGLANTFKNKSNYPFGQAFIRGYVSTVQNTLERNARYSFNTSVGGFTSQQFSRNFNQGGWEAWKVASLPQNNPLGFSLMASDDLNQKLAGTKQSAAQDVRDELNQGLGFLSPKICVDPMGYVPPANATISASEVENMAHNDPLGLINQMGLTPEQVAQSIGVGVEDLNNLSPEQIDQLISNAQSAGYGQYVDMCKRYETSTPGGVVSSQLTAALNIPKDNLLLAPEDLDSSLQAVFDALLNQLFKKGLSSLSDLAGNNPSNSSTQVYSSGGYGNNATAASTTTNSSSNTNEQWFTLNSDFDITDPTDIQEIIDTQNAYIKAVIDDPAVAAPVLNVHSLYPSAITLSANQKGQNFWLNKIIPEIGQLDYCIPGPHPGWEEGAQIWLQGIESDVPEVKNMSSTTLGEISDAITAGFATPIVNIVSNILRAGNMTADDHKKAKIYTGFLIKYTGIVALVHDDRDNQKTVKSREKLIAVLDTLFSRLANEINNVRFKSANLPMSANESADFFSRISGYQAIINNNNQDIASLRDAVRRMTEIKQQITDLNTRLANNTITQTEYDNTIDFIRRAFAGFTENLVTNDDTQSITTQTEQIISDIVYIHNSLLLGPSGCEATYHLVPVQSQIRVSYPQSHLYDYPGDNFTFLKYTVFGEDTNFSDQLPTGSDVIYMTDQVDFKDQRYFDTVPVFEQGLRLW